MRTWIVYALEFPIDFWHGALALPQYLGNNVDEYWKYNEHSSRVERDSCLYECACDQVERVEEFLSAVKAAESAGYIRNNARVKEECVFHIPCGDTMRVAFVFKHDNNGNTFVVTPLPIVQLDRSEAECSRFTDNGEQANEDTEWVYFLRMGDLIKIGVSQDVDQRIKSYKRTEYPHETELLATCPGGFAKEKELHARFAHARVKGEWFSQVPELMQYIENIVNENVVNENIVNENVANREGEPCRS